MFNIIQDLIVKSDSPMYWKWIAFLLSLVLIALICVIARAILYYVLKIILKTLDKKKSYTWVEESIRHKLPGRTANLIVPVILYNTLSDPPFLLPLLNILIICILVTVAVQLFNAVVAVINDIYNEHDISKTRPIKGILQVIQIIVYIVIAIIAIAAVMGKNPVVLLGGIGAAAAVVSFIFKDPILGFVAGVQLINNNMLRIGDWITMEQYHADGIVQEISMTTVKVVNFDNSLTSIPAQVMVNDAFINWRHMEESRCRRLKRSIYIDSKSIKICDEKLLSKLNKLKYLEGPLEQNINEKVEYTNIGCFRAYVKEYIKIRSDIRDDMPIIVHQLDSKAKGLPLEIYAFINTTDWSTFENIQSDIFDHFYSILPEFDLRIYQENIAE